MSSTKTNRPGDSQSKTICLPSLFGSMTIKDSVDASFHTLPAHLGPHVHLGSVCMDTSSFKLWLLSASACGQNRTRTEHRKHLPLNLRSPETTLHQKRGRILLVDECLCFPHPLEKNSTPSTWLLRAPLTRLSHSCLGQEHPVNTLCWASSLPQFTSLSPSLVHFPDYLPAPKTASAAAFRRIILKCNNNAKIFE